MVSVAYDDDVTDAGHIGHITFTTANGAGPPIQRRQAEAEMGGGLELSLDSCRSAVCDSRDGAALAARVENHERG